MDSGNGRVLLAPSQDRQVLRFHSRWAQVGERVLQRHCGLSGRKTLCTLTRTYIVRKTPIRTKVHTEFLPILNIRKSFCYSHKLSLSVAGGFLSVGLLAACSTGAGADQANAGSQVESSATAAADATSSPFSVLSSTAWETTRALDANGDDVELNDRNVSNFVGNAYFHCDGTFNMYNLDDSAKMQGDWSVSDVGKTRTIVAKDDAGKVQFARASDIVTLTADEFTYRVFPDPEKTDVYFDIVHTPTDHSEPAAS